MPKKSNAEEFIKKAIKVHSNEYCYDLVNYINDCSNVKIICRFHGIFEQIANNHLNGAHCNECSLIIRANKQKFSIQKFVEMANHKHDNKYDYSLSVYINTKSKIEIICGLHGPFWQTPNHHLKGIGCPECGGTKKINTEEFIIKADKKHNFTYNYSLVNYKNAKLKIIIICKQHGKFEQSAGSHLQGIGCPECGGKSKSDTIKFIEKANKKHNFKYDYSLSNYVNSESKVIIICRIHEEEFEQTVNNHLSGHGCSKCVSSISKTEIKWLNSLNIPEEYRHKTIRINDKRYYVDAYDLNINTIYEFYGDYWHGNPAKFKPDDINKMNNKTYGELYQRTLQKENEL